MTDDDDLRLHCYVLLDSRSSYFRISSSKTNKYIWHRRYARWRKSSSISFCIVGFTDAPVHSLIISNNYRCGSMLHFSQLITQQQVRSSIDDDRYTNPKLATRVPDGFSVLHFKKEANFFFKSDNTFFKMNRVKIILKFYISRRR